MTEAASTQPSGYFETYRDERPSATPRQYAPRSRRKPRPPVFSLEALNCGLDDSNQRSPGSISAQLDFFTAPSRSTRRQASARPSRLPSSTVSPSPSTLGLASLSPPDSPFSDIHLGRTRTGPSADTLDALCEVLPKSPGRRGRASSRSHRQRSDSHRRREQELDWHSRELKAKLQSLASQRQDFSDTGVAETPKRAQTEPPLSMPPLAPIPRQQAHDADDSQLQSISSSTASLPSIVMHEPKKHYTGLVPQMTPAALFPSVAASPPERPPIPSIHELVGAHNARLQAAQQPHTYSNPPKVVHRSEPPLPPPSVPDKESDASSIDSVIAEALNLPQPKTSHRPDLAPSRILKPSRSMSDLAEQQRSLLASTNTPKRSDESELAAFLRSPRLTRLLRLSGPSSKPLRVSLADVGDPHGHSVIVFLGLGCVRYLIALYDELAKAMHLRLICIDRWGLGKTTAVPDSQWSFTEWAKVVEAVAEELRLKHFSLLAHSAGTPYALAASLRCHDRIAGSLHLLAPWVNSSVKGQSPQYKLLKFVPNTLLTTAQATEWKMQAWKLGRPPNTLKDVDPLADLPRPIDPSQWSSPPSPIETLMDDHADVAKSSSTSQKKQNTTRLNGLRSVSITNMFAVKKDPHESSTTSNMTAQENVSPSEEACSSGHITPLARSSSSTFQRRKSIASPESLDLSTEASSEASGTPANPKSHSAVDLTKGLLKASYAESLSGGTQDLLAILERMNKPHGFTYADIRHPVKVWYGDRDDKVSLASVQAFQHALLRCQLQVVPGADHGLMTNASVMYEVLDSIRAESEDLSL